MTEFASIYDKFLSRIEDYGYADMLMAQAKAEQDGDTATQQEIEEEFDDILSNFLKSAISQFKYVCRKDLYDVTETGFNETLDEEEMEILTYWMVVSYVDSNMITEEHMRNFLNSGDYRQYSSANLLKQLQETRKMFKTDAEGMMSKYAMYHFKKDWEEKNG